MLGLYTVSILCLIQMSLGFEGALAYGGKTSGSRGKHFLMAAKSYQADLELCLYIYAENRFSKIRPICIVFL